jgi:hypothetical protein
MMILCLPGGSVTFFWANALIRLRTTSIPVQTLVRTTICGPDHPSAGIVSRSRLNIPYCSHSGAARRIMNPLPPRALPWAARVDMPITPGTPLRHVAGQVGSRGLPLSSLAFSSRTASLYASPNICLAKHNILVVFPIPGIPLMITCGMFPSLAMILRRSMVSVFPTMSER